MKILTCNKYYYIHGGADTYFFALNRLLGRAGHQVIPFATKNRKNIPCQFDEFFARDMQPPPVDRWEVFSFLSWMKDGFNGVYSLEGKIKIKKLIARTRPDLAHIHNIYHHISPSILSAIKDNKIPIVMTLHDYKLICANYSLFDGRMVCECCKGHKHHNAVMRRCFKGSLLYSLLVSLEMQFHRLLRIYERYVDLFIVVSQLQKTKMEEFGVPLRKIRFLPHFIDAEIYEPAFSNKGYFVFLGRLEKIKGVDVLLRAIQSSKLSQQIKLKIIGDGSEKTALMDYCERKNLNSIEFFGFVSEEEKIRIMQGAIMTIVPSVWYETFGLVILESFALGKAVIASRIGGIPEIVNEGENGLLFNPGDSEDLRKKIEYYLCHQEEAALMGESARRKAEEYYAPSRHLDGLLKIYEEVGVGSLAASG